MGLQRQQHARFLVTFDQHGGTFDRCAPAVPSNVTRNSVLLAFDLSARPCCTRMASIRTGASPRGGTRRTRGFLSRLTITSVALVEAAAVLVDGDKKQLDVDVRPLHLGARANRGVDVEQQESLQPAHRRARR